MEDMHDNLPLMEDITRALLNYTVEVDGDKHMLAKPNLASQAVHIVQLTNSWARQYTIGSIVITIAITITITIDIIIIMLLFLGGQGGGAGAERALRDADADDDGVHGRPHRILYYTIL